MNYTDFALNVTLSGAIAVKDSATPFIGGEYAALLSICWMLGAVWFVSWLLMRVVQFIGFSFTSLIYFLVCWRDKSNLFDWLKKDVYKEEVVE